MASKQDAERIERVAKAISLWDSNDWDGLLGSRECVRDRYRSMARAAIEADVDQDSVTVTVPREPTETMWGGLARDIVMWTRFDRPSERALLQHLRRIGRNVPDWLSSECRDIDHVPPKGSVAVWIYKAMLDDAPRA